MRHIVCILLFMFMSNAKAASAKDFLIKLPGQWQQLEAPESNVQVFRNLKSRTNQIVVAHLIRYASPSRMGTSDLLAAKDRISKAREAMLRHLAIGQDRIHSMEAEPAPFPEFESVITLEASYRSLSHNDVQVVERQYIARDRMIQVVYSEEAADLGDRERIKHVLDNVKPRKQSRSFAAQFADWIAGQNVRASEVVKPGSGSATANPDTVAEKDIEITEPKGAKPSEIKDLCDSLKPGLRSSDSDTPVTFAMFKDKCLEGSGGVAKELWKLVKDVAKTAWEHELPVADLKETAKTAWNAVYRYSTDSAYYAETNNTALAMIEAVKDAPKMIQQVYIKVYNFMTQSDPPFVCYKADYKIKAICGFMTGVVTGRAVGGVAKILTGKMSPAMQKLARTSIKDAGDDAVGTAKENSLTQAKAEATGQTADTVEEAFKPSLPPEKRTATTASQTSDGKSASLTPASSAASAGSGATASVSQPSPANLKTTTMRLSKKTLSSASKKFLEEVATGDRKRYLEAASKLSETDRVAVSEVLLKKDLSKADKDLILKAHQVGEGKDYYEKGSNDPNRLSHTNLRENVGTLKQTSLSKEEQKVPMNYGITGGGESLSFSDPNAVRGNRLAAGASKRPLADALDLDRGGSSEKAKEYYRAEAERARRQSSYRSEQAAIVQAGDIGEAALTLRQSRERMNEAMATAKQERARLVRERDDRKITNKGSDADGYYNRQIQNQDAWIEQIRLERDSLD